MVFYAVLLVVGLICIVGSFLISEKIDDKLLKSQNENSQDLMNRVIENNKDLIVSSANSSVEELKEQVIEDVTREFNRLSNEKIMAVDEFSDTVLEKINQNHSEVIFMYNMLVEKENELKQSMNAERKEGSKLATESKTAASKKGNEKPVRKQEKKAVKNNASKLEETIDLTKQDKQREAQQRENILNAYESGESVTDIAKNLGIGKGEVKLIIDLYQGAK